MSYELHVQKTRRTDGNQRNRQGSLSTSSPQTGKRSESHHSHIGDDRQANTRHDADLSNLYNGPESYNDENNPPSWADQAEYDHDSSRWIHRDKLLEIETQELRTAGIYVLPTERIETRLEEIAREREERRKCYDSSLPPNDLRTPEEVAAELMRLKNGSKIPLSVQSPIPVPEEYKERTTPFKWTIGHHSAPGSATNGSHVRRRSHSTGSSYLLDSAPAATARTPKVTPKSKTTTSKSTHTTPQSTPRGRKNANARGRGGAMAKKRTRSNPQLYNRPKTSGSASVTSPKPSNHYTPEGVEPPWAVASYKPDPRLPPDQQIIPTVAKRLAQEKWEREGAFASVYDPKLRPLKVHDDWKNVERPPKTENEEKEEKEQTVPKEPPQSPKEVYSTVPPVCNLYSICFIHFLTLLACTFTSRPGTKAPQNGPSDRAAQASPRSRSGSPRTRQRKEGHLLLHSNVTKTNQYAFCLQSPIYPPPSQTLFPTVLLRLASFLKPSMLWHFISSFIGVSIRFMVSLFVGFWYNIIFYLIILL